jgi:hypothetical protein
MRQLPAKVLPFPKRGLRVTLSRFASGYSLQFSRYHTGEAPERTSMRLSYLQIIGRGMLWVAGLGIVWLMVTL